MTLGIKGSPLATATIFLALALSRLSLVSGSPLASLSLLSRWRDYGWLARSARTQRLAYYYYLPLLTVQSSPSSPRSSSTPPPPTQQRQQQQHGHDGLHLCDSKQACPPQPPPSHAAKNGMDESSLPWMTCWDNACN